MESNTWGNAAGLSSNPRIYSTVHVGLVDKESGEVIEALYDHAAQHQESLALALARFSTEKYPDGNLMRYFSLPDNRTMEAAIKEKIQEARLTAHAVGETLYAALDLTMSADLTDEELDAFQEQLEFQYRDGWGAEFELADFQSGADLVYMRLHHDDLCFYTADVFEAMFGSQKGPESPQAVPIIPEGKQLTKEEAIALSDSGWWKDKTAREIAEFQLHQQRLCMPFDKFQEAVEEALDRPIWTHEFAVAGRLQEEYKRVMQAQANGTPAPKVGIDDVIGCLGQLVGDDAPGEKDLSAENEGPRLLFPGQ